MKRWVTVGHEAVRLTFRLGTKLAGFLEEKKRCRIAKEERCVLCDQEEVEDVVHFLLGCEELENDGIGGVIEESGEGSRAVAGEVHKRR